MSKEPDSRDFMNGTNLEILDNGVGMKLDLTPDDALTAEQRASGEALRSEVREARESWTEGTRDAHMARVNPEWKVRAEAWLAAMHGIKIVLARQA